MGKLLVPGSFPRDERGKAGRRPCPISAVDPHNSDMARRKAYTARTFGVTSLEFAKRTAGASDLASQRNLAEVIALGGGVPIMIGAEKMGASA